MLLVTMAAVLGPRDAKSEAPIPILQAGSQTFTNVSVEVVTATHLFIRHAGGMNTVKLADLNQDLQKRFGYDAARAAAIESAVPYTLPSARGGSWGQNPAKSAGDGNISVSYKPVRGLATKEFPLGDKGRLLLHFPNNWLDSFQSSPRGEPLELNIRFEPQYGDNFVLVVTTIPAESGIKQMGIQRVMEMVRNHSLRVAIETTLQLQPVKGIETDGYYYSLTDKALFDKEVKPGKFKYQVQGLVTIDDFALSFTLLYNYRQLEQEKACLEMIKQAQFLKP